MRDPERAEGPEGNNGRAKGVGALAEVRSALSDYHFALDRRQHGGAAADAALRRVQEALNMPWVPGAEAARRAGHG